MVPILITCWKRPQKVIKLINAIRSVKPKILYVACDGPDLLSQGNKEKVFETRKIVLNNIDWDCKLLTLFSEKNLGCRYAMTKAINWFFENENLGIILEDDCIPSEEFFTYTSELLFKYKDKKNVWSISGNNFQDGIVRGESSYYFSKYFHCWGWGTWRDRWQKYDSELDQWSNSQKELLIKKIFVTKEERIFWSKIFNNLVLYNKPDSWAYRWAFTCFINKGLSVIPNKNLVKNIGFDDEATNTKNGIIRNDIAHGLIPLKHPESISINNMADKYTFDNHFNTGTFNYKIRKFYKEPLYYPKRFIEIFKIFNL